MINCNTVNIKKGSKGATVIELQKYLTFLKLYDGKIDGECGDYTVNSIKLLQKQKKQVQDGVFGPQTCKASGINGTDVSNTCNTIHINTWKNMMQRYDSYVKTQKKEPAICYVNIDTKYQYITNKQYKDIKKRYDDYITQNKKEPDLVYVNKPTVTKENTTKSTSNVNITQYVSGPHWTSKGCNKLGQCTPYYCACHSLRQVLAKFNIDSYTEGQLAGIMGTTTAGTGHSGINTAIKYVSNKTGVKLDYEWKNFSDFGNTTKERWTNLGKRINESNCDCIIHSQYRYGESNRGRGFGHYETIWKINTKNNQVTVLNSLGSHSTRSAYYGYIEERSFDRFAKYIAHTYAGQKSICLITKG